MDAADDAPTLTRMHTEHTHAAADDLLTHLRALGDRPSQLLWAPLYRALGAVPPSDTPPAAAQWPSVAAHYAHADQSGAVVYVLGARTLVEARLTRHEDPEAGVREQVDSSSIPLQRVRQVRESTSGAQAVVVVEVDAGQAQHLPGDTDGVLVWPPGMVISSSQPHHAAALLRFAAALRGRL